MTLTKTCLAACATLLWLATSPAQAASSAASSASDSASTSSGASSTSFEKSSDGSSKTNRVAEGDYQVIDVAAVPDRPGTVRMTLRAAAADAAQGDTGEFALFLPAQAVDSQRIAPGHTVTAHHRAYGLEFARGDNQQAFYLVLDDDWHRELASNPVML